MSEQTADTALLLVDKKPDEPKARASSTPIAIAAYTQVGRFGLIRELARGGMGQVFLARDTKLGRKVAIKFLLDDSPSFVNRFLIEARATAACTHENIVTIYEVGEHDGLPFMVLEYLKGKTLTELLVEKTAPRQFAELMVSVARALERAHEHGIVHRDLKPGNIFVTDRGIVKVLDFGVAKLFASPVEGAAALDKLGARNQGMDESGSRHNVAGIDPSAYVTFSGNGWIVGTLPYMSPEQWGAGEVDHASDIWAMGILFWRALAGVHPAGTGDPAKLHARMMELDKPLPSLATRDPNIPKELVAIADKCLAMNKPQRYASAAALLAELLAFVQPKAASRTVEDVSPYRGLAAFGETDSKFFFGRSGEVRSAVAQLETWPLLAVIGPTGVGKSSFVHAGLIPAMRAVGGPWNVKNLRPGRAPMTSLVGVLDYGLDADGISDLAEQLQESPGHFGEALRTQAAKEKTKLLIVVDQLEELFTLSDDPVARETFLAALLGAADDASSPVRVVLSMRADFLDRLAGDRHFLSELSRGLFFLSAPDRENLRETLVRPAELAGYTFEKDSIVDHIVQTATSRGALPLLQFAATKLWDARDRSRKIMTAASYDAMGGVAGAFSRHADEVAAAIPPQHQTLLRAILTRLVTPEGTRAVVDRAELLSLGKSESDVEHILDQLVRGRLVHVHTDPVEATSVEIVHETLISEWPTLKRWLDDSNAVRAFLHDLQQAAKKWASSGKPSELVWRGAPAREAISMAERHVLDLAGSERAFLLEVQRQASRGRRRRIFAFTSILAVLVAIIGAGSIAVFRISEAEQLATQRAVSAANEALRAKEAEGQAAARLEALEAEARARKAAEADARAKGSRVEVEEQKRLQAELEKRNAELEALNTAAAAKTSREDHETSTAELENAVEQLERERANIQRQLDQAKRDFEDVRVNNMRLQTQLAAERQRVQQLQQQRDDNPLR